MIASRLTGAVVAGLTFVAIGVLLALEAEEVLEIPAGVLAALLLIGLGLAVLARAGRRPPGA